ncbi:hypothetical protein FB451DRAFT_1370647 [Mycena latifolia]|nr:hypothetical protein FB451DRAFT_1370647 [Mycena latifolia]
MDIVIVEGRLEDEQLLLEARNMRDDAPGFVSTAAPHVLQILVSIQRVRVELELYLGGEGVALSPLRLFGGTSGEQVSVRKEETTPTAKQRQPQLAPLLPGPDPTTRPKRRPGKAKVPTGQRIGPKIRAEETRNRGTGHVMEDMQSAFTRAFCTIPQTSGECPQAFLPPLTTTHPPTCTVCARGADRESDIPAQSQFRCRWPSHGEHAAWVLAMPCTSKPTSVLDAGSNLRRAPPGPFGKPRAHSTKRVARHGSVRGDLTPRALSLMGGTLTMPRIPLFLLSYAARTPSARCVVLPLRLALDERRESYELSVAYTDTYTRPTACAGKYLARVLACQCYVSWAGVRTSGGVDVRGIAGLYCGLCAEPHACQLLMGPPMSTEYFHRLVLIWPL